MNSLLLTLLMSTFIILCISFFFVLFGNKVFRIFKIYDNSLPIQLEIAGSFFIGMGMLLGLWKLVDFILKNAITSLACSFIFLCIYCFIPQFNLFKKNIIRIGIFYYKNLPLFTLLFLIIFICNLFYWVQPTVEFSLSAFNNLLCLGSLHSGRYRNITQFIIDNNYVPILSQNYGQSILSAIPHIFGINSPFLNLFIWLITSIFYLYFLIFGLFRFFSISTRKSIWATIILMFGNYTLSFIHILTIDSGSPFAMNGYTDTIYSIGSFVMFLLILHYFLIKKIQLSFSVVFIIATLSISWAFTSPQNTVSVFIVISLFVIYCFFIKSKYFKRLLVFTTLISLSFFIGVGLGGMFTPKFMLEKEKIIGVISPTNNVVNKGLRPIFAMYHFYGVDTMKIEVEYPQFSSIKNAEGLIEKIKSFYFNFFYIIEKNIFDSFRIVFWPFIGIVLTGLIFRQKKLLKDKDKKLNNKFSLYFELWVISIFLFLFGYTVNMFIGYNDFKWELSRFLIPGYFLGMFFLLISLTDLFAKLPSKKHSLIAYVITLFVLTCGPITFHVLRSVNHVINNSFLDCIKLLITLN